MKSKSQMGRPRTRPKGVRTHNVYFTDREWAQVRRAAKRAGQSAAAWMRGILLAAT